MASAGDDIEVAHDAGARRFVARANGRGEVLGYLAYEAADGALDLQHTVVMPDHRNQGIGESLVRAALDHARATDGRIVPTCPFVAAYLDEHPGERPGA